MKAERINVAIIAPASAPFDRHVESIFVVFGVVIAPLRSRKGSGGNPPPMGFCVRRNSTDIITEWNDQHLLIDIFLHQFECRKKRMNKRSCYLIATHTRLIESIDLLNERSSSNEHAKKRKRQVNIARTIGIREE